MENGILSLIGRTPLVELRRMFGADDFRLFVKLEGCNPAGSSKDRPAKELICSGFETGAINADTVIVESSSGNMGIGLAQVCRYFGLRFICVVDPRTAPPNLKLLSAYGAEIDYVAEPDPETGDFLRARLNRVQELLGEIENSYWPNQYANLNNSNAHYKTTIPEIVNALGRVDYFFCATSTCGTIRGCAEYLKASPHPTTVVAVDAVGSVLFGFERGKRLIPGLGAGVIPPLCKEELVDAVVRVSAADCIVGCRRLMRDEAILAGGSSGGVITAVERWRNRIPPGANCVAILPDRGERYLDTVYSDEWVLEKVGNIFHLWQDEGFGLPPTEVNEPWGPANLVVGGGEKLGGAFV